MHLGTPGPPPGESGFSPNTVKAVFVLTALFSPTSLAHELVSAWANVGTSACVWRPRVRASDTVAERGPRTEGPRRPTSPWPQTRAEEPHHRAQRPRTPERGPTGTPTHLATASSTWGSCSHFFRASTLLVFLWGRASRKMASDHSTPGVQTRRHHPQTQASAQTCVRPHVTARGVSSLEETHRGHTCPLVPLPARDLAAPRAEMGQFSRDDRVVTTGFTATNSVTSQLRIYRSGGTDSASADTSA